LKLPNEGNRSESSAENRNRD